MWTDREIRLKSLFRAALLTAILCSPACADELKIDGTSKETFAKSVGAMAATLSPADKEVFQKGLMNLMVTKYPPAEGAEGLQMLAFMPQAIEVAHVTLNGYTRNQILEHGRKLGAASAAKVKTVDNRAQVEDCLRKALPVTGAAVVKGDFGRSVTMSVTNNLKWAVSFLHIHYVVSTPGRSVAWVDKTFGGSISGGIEPGETREVQTSAYDLPREAVNLEVKAEVIDVADPQKRQLVGKTRYVNTPEELSPNKCG